MSTSHRRIPLLAAIAVGLVGLAACTAGPGASPAPTSTAAPSWDSVHAAPPQGRVIGVGTVIDAARDAQLCLGAIMESSPPQCEGLPLTDWSWEGVDGYESSGETTWGSYAVYGAFDGERLTITDPPIMLALYDPAAPEDPTGGVDGTTSATDLARIQDELDTAAIGAGALTVRTDRGYVWVGVTWDDGTLQDAMDAEDGPGVVIVSSALRAID